MTISSNLPDGRPAPLRREIQDSDRDVITQIRVAFSHPLPLVVGALVGALVPIGTFVVGHSELGGGWVDARSLIFLGGLMFSAITVYRWGRRTFGSSAKALCFVLLAEGLMSFSTVGWLSAAALAYLVAINAIANGCSLAIQHAAAQEADRERAREADATVVAAPFADAIASALASLEARLESRLADLRAAAAPVTLVTPTPEFAAAPSPVALIAAASSGGSGTAPSRRTPKTVKVAKASRATRSRRTAGDGSVVN